MVTVEILAATKKYILIILYPVNTLMVKGSHQIPRCNIKNKEASNFFGAEYSAMHLAKKNAEKLGT